MDIRVDNLDKLIDKFNGLFGIVLICLVAGFLLLLKYDRVRGFHKFLAFVCQVCMVIFFLIGLSGLALIAFDYAMEKFSDSATYAQIVREKSELEKRVEELTVMNETLKSDSQEKSELEKRIDELTAENSKLKSENESLSNVAKDALESISLNALSILAGRDFDLNMFIASFSGSQFFHGHHYKFFSSYITWERAKKYCENVGGHLVTINSAEENDFVRELIRQRGYRTSDIWLGAIKKKGRLRWEWLTEEPVTFSKWNPSQSGMESSKNGEYRLYVIKDEWRDWSSGDSGSGYYICEWDF